MAGQREGQQDFSLSFECANAPPCNIPAVSSEVEDAGCPQPVLARQEDPGEALLLYHLGQQYTEP